MEGMSCLVSVSSPPGVGEGSWEVLSSKESELCGPATPWAMPVI